MDIYFIIPLNIILTLGISFSTDKIFSFIIRPECKYFCMHVLLNLYICYITYQSTITFFLNPITNYDFFSEDGVKSASIVIGFHLYHILTEKLSLEDKMHHIVTVFITGSTALIKPCGNILAAINFIMCGLPGGIDYFLLVLVKYNIITKLVEKYINRWLNLIIRMPCMMLCFWYSMLNLYYNNITIENDYLNITSVILMTINSIYYCNKTVGNYHVRAYEKFMLY